MIECLAAVHIPPKNTNYSGARTLAANGFEKAVMLLQGRCFCLSVGRRGALPLLFEGKYDARRKVNERLNRVVFIEEYCLNGTFSSFETLISPRKHHSKQSTRSMNQRTTAVRRAFWNAILRVLRTSFQSSSGGYSIKHNEEHNIFSPTRQYVVTYGHKNTSTKHGKAEYRKYRMLCLIQNNVE